MASMSICGLKALTGKKVRLQGDAWKERCGTMLSQAEGMREERGAGTGLEAATRKRRQGFFCGARVIAGFTDSSGDVQSHPGGRLDIWEGRAVWEKEQKDESSTTSQEWGV